MTAVIYKKEERRRSWSVYITSIKHLVIQGATGIIPECIWQNCYLSEINSTKLHVLCVFVGLLYIL